MLSNDREGVKVLPGGGMMFKEIQLSDGGVTESYRRRAPSPEDLYRLIKPFKPIVLDSDRPKEHVSGVSSAEAGDVELNGTQREDDVKESGSENL